jgi:hypothetical protein
LRIGRVTAAVDGSLQRGSVPGLATPIDKGAQGELQLVPTLLCIYGAGFASSLVSAVWLGGLSASGPERLPLLAAQAVLGAAVGAVALRSLLPRVTGFTASLGASFLALSGGAIVETLLTVAVRELGQHAHGAAPPRTSLAVSLGSWLIGAFIAFRVLQSTAVAVVADTVSAASESTALAATMIAADRAALSPEAQPPAAAAPASDDWASAATPPADADPYTTAARAACETALSLVASVGRTEPTRVTQTLIEGLPLLQAATGHLAHLRPLDDERGRILVAALEQLEDELVEISAHAGTASTTIYERGWTSGRMTDISDHGARARFDLSQSKAVAAIRAALRDLS